MPLGRVTVKLGGMEDCTTKLGTGTDPEAVAH